MFKKITQTVTIVVFATCLYFSSFKHEPIADEMIVAAVSSVSIKTTKIEVAEIQPNVVPIVTSSAYTAGISESTTNFPITDAEIDLIALITMAEAEGECEEGKRLVIDTILNRLDHEDFPNTVTDVIYQQDQFSSVWNGRIDQCFVMDDIRLLVCDELKSRRNADVIYFTAGHYGKYGKPMFSIENHYFSSY